MKKLPALSATAILLAALAVTVASAEGLTRRSDEIALWTGSSPGLGALAYTLDLDLAGGVPVHRVFEGSDIGRPAYLFNNRHLFDGLNRAKAEFTFSPDGRRVYAGPIEAGRPIYFLEPLGPVIRVHSGPNVIGPILYTFADNRVYEGANTHGDILLTTDRNLLLQPAPVVQVIVILLEMAPR